jgi:hypothetical protein
MSGMTNHSASVIAAKAAGASHTIAPSNRMSVISSTARVRATRRKKSPAIRSRDAFSTRKPRSDWWKSTRCAADGAMRHDVESAVASSVP